MDRLKPVITSSSMKGVVRRGSLCSSLRQVLRLLNQALLEVQTKSCDYRGSFCQSTGSYDRNVLLFPFCRSIERGWDIRSVFAFQLNPLLLFVPFRSDVRSMLCLESLFIQN